MEAPDSDLEQDSYIRSDRGVRRGDVTVSKKPVKYWDVAFYGAPSWYMVGSVEKWPDYSESIVANNYKQDSLYRGSVHGVFFNPRTGAGSDDAQGNTEFIVEGVFTKIYAFLPMSKNVHDDNFAHITETSVFVWLELLHIPGAVSPWDVDGYNDIPGSSIGFNSGYYTWDGLYEPSAEPSVPATVFLRNTALRRGVKSIWRKSFELKRTLLNFSGQKYDNCVWLTSDQAEGSANGALEGLIGADEVLCATKQGTQWYFKNFQGQDPVTKQPVWGPVQQHFDASRDIFVSDDYCSINRTMITKDVDTSIKFTDFASQGSFVIAAWSNQQTVGGDPLIPPGMDVLRQLPHIDINMRFRFRQK